MSEYLQVGDTRYWVCDGLMQASDRGKVFIGFRTYAEYESFVNRLDAEPAVLLSAVYNHPPYQRYYVYSQRGTVFGRHSFIKVHGRDSLWTLYVRIGNLENVTDTLGTIRKLTLLID